MDDPGPRAGPDNRRCPEDPECYDIKARPEVLAAGGDPLEDRGKEGNGGYDEERRDHAQSDAESPRCGPATPDRLSKGSTPLAIGQEEDDSDDPRDAEREPAGARPGEQRGHPYDGTDDEEGHDPPRPP